MDDAFKNVLRTLAGAGVEAGIKKLDERAKAQKAGAAKPSGPSLTIRQIFGYSADVKLTEAMIRKRYRELAAVYHPDVDAERTDTAMFVTLTKIRDRLLAELKK